MVGVKVTEKVHDTLGASEAPQVVVSEKSPLIEVEDIVRVAVPVLVRVTV